jgi:hypothetical protein
MAVKKLFRIYLKLVELPALEWIHDEIWYVRMIYSSMEELYVIVFSVPLLMHGLRAKSKNTFE